MTSEWIRAGLDLALIGLIAAGVWQAARLLRQLEGLNKSREEMARFVGQFGQTVDRAEAGIKNLKQAARETGDDLERLVERGSMLRDELQIIVESADHLASRLSQAAASARAEKAPEKTPANEAAPAAKKPAAPQAAQPAVSSRAEKELMQALEKLG